MIRTMTVKESNSWDVSGLAFRRCFMNDLAVVAILLGFSALSWGLIALCDRLMGGNE